ncbi:hypothetical protein LTR15_002984 [Elasticomyces elasticus]|nr:hypothetical protein LTR15_002984 [Elasticomyces elasticus]
MDELEPSAHAGPLISHPPDLMNDTTFDPPVRINTSSTTDDRNGDTCRICRSEGTPEEPLFYPCKCSGSIKYVHQECLMEWLSHSHKKHCELCKTPFRFTKLYDAEMPQTLPLAVFIRRACWHAVWTAGRLGRGMMVVAVWAIVLPWLVRWAWRWIFWFADAGWTHEAVMSRLKNDDYGMSAVFEKGNKTMSVAFNSTAEAGNTTTGPAAYQIAKEVAKRLGFTSPLSTSSPLSTFPEADTSILSSWTYLSTLTPSPRLNRIIVDICEGQLITCVVIVGFILIFLIREWVVQQGVHPVNLDNINNVQQQLADAAERVQAENARLRRQQELLEQARRRLLELQDESRDARRIANDVHGDAEEGEYIGWEGLEMLIDHATEHLRKDDEQEKAKFKYCTQAVLKQIHLAGLPVGGNITDGLAEQIATKLASFSTPERQEWEALLIDQLAAARDDQLVATRDRASSDPGHSEPVSDEVKKMRHIKALSSSSSSDESSGAAEPARPRMPERDFSSRATQIQRLLEEAEGIFSPQEVAAARASVRSQAQTHLALTAENITSGNTMALDESQPGGKPVTGEADQIDNDAKAEYDELPITNAGPDAKVNIKRSGKGKARAVPEPKEPTPADVLKRQAEDEAMKKLEEEIKVEDSVAGPASAPTEIAPASDNPFHPEGPEPEPRQDQGIGREIASELIAVDAPDYDEAIRQRPTNDAAAADAVDGDEDAEEQRPPRAIVPPTYLNRLADWFWGDIIVGHDHAEQAAPEDEQILAIDDVAQAAPLVAVINAQPLVDAAHIQDPAAAAAQQAALDADAVDEAEDLEGIFELIGLQGPLLGLFQTSTFCTALVAVTVLCAVGLPYIWGKLVLNILGSPVHFTIKLPLRIMSTVADFLVDVTLWVAGWTASLKDVSVAKWVADFAAATATKSATRLQNMIMTMESYESEVMNWNEAFLGVSVHAHASLREIQDEVAVVMNWMGHCVTVVVEAISSGTVSTAWHSCLEALSHAGDIPIHLGSGFEYLKSSAQPLLRTLEHLKTGSLSFEKGISVEMEPSLIYWSGSDRTLAVIAGYVSLALLAAIYVALDTPLSRSEAGRKTEKQIRDGLKQAGGVLKVMLIISIEMLVFPFYCGLLLDLAFLPLFAGASMASRWSFAGDQPYTFCFVHWFIGTCYMFHFALFVGMCRKILRKGVLWFIRDPDDPTFHPVRDVLERNVSTQLRKIAFSALVYGALVILCLGGVIWTIGKVLNGIFPIYWKSTEPILEFPADLLLYNALTPLIVRLVKPSDAVSAMYAWWLRRCARVLRLSHFLFDDRRKDEEGHYVRKTWASFLLLQKPEEESKDSIPTTHHITEHGEEGAEVHFARDGKYVLTPCSDQYRPPKAGEAFLHADDDDVYVVDKNGKKNDHFAKIYVPPLFRLRVTLFMVCLWVFSALTGLCVTLVPLVFGRRLFAGLMPKGVRPNDIYCYTLGSYILGGLLIVALQGRPAVRYLQSKVGQLDIKSWAEPAKRYVLQTLSCAYVYGFIAAVLPLVFGCLLQLYFVLPLHTYVMQNNIATSANITETAASLAANLTNIAFEASPFNTTSPVTAATQMSKPLLSSHTIHILQDYCLGLLYVRIASRFVIFTPSTRAHEAFHRILLDPGYLNPNARIATRFLIAPVTILAAIAILLPPAMVRLALAATHNNGTWSSVLSDPEIQIKMYRYSYPVTAALVVMLVCLSEVGGATNRWRARIKDEVYLVGERLHNFGEKKPPKNSRSVVRKDR